MAQHFGLVKALQISSTVSLLRYVLRALTLLDQFGYVYTLHDHTYDPFHHGGIPVLTCGYVEPVLAASVLSVCAWGNYNKLHYYL